MSWQAPYSGEEEDEEKFEDDEEMEAMMKGRDCLIYVIDTSPAMHEPLESGKSFFQIAIKTAISLLLNKIINSESDLVGIVFYGTKKSKNTHSFDNIFVYNELEPPYAKRIADLENLESNQNIFDEEFGASDTYAFHEALWICNSMFAKAAKKMDTKRVFLMTNNDNPNGDRAELQRSAVTRASDNIIKMAEDETNFSLSDSGGKLEELMKQVRQKEFKKRTAFRVPFILGEDLEIGVAGYNLVTEVKPSSYTYLLGATNEEVKVVTSHYCSTTSQQLGPTDMDSYYEFGGAK
ncbi:X-ray repair cross-complementing protein 6, partial [Dinochytrium kinnereticum]